MAKNGPEALLKNTTVDGLSAGLASQEAPEILEPSRTPRRHGSSLLAKVSFRNWHLCTP